MRYSKRISLLCFAFVAVLLLSLFVRRNQRYIYELSVFAQGENSVVVDQTDDVKSLGYSGQRKISAFDDKIFFVVYRKKIEGRYQIFSKKITVEGQKISVGGGSPVANVETGGNQRVPSVAVSADKTIHVVWYGSNQEENNRQIKYVQSSDGGVTWSNWKNIAEVEGYSGGEYWQEHPVIITDGKKTLVAWEGKDLNNEKQQIKFTSSDDGGKTWTHWKNVGQSQGFTQSRPVLAMYRGKLFAFMYSSQGNNNDVQQIQYAYSDTLGETWSNWRAISDPNFDARHVTVVSDANDEQGALHIAWRQQDISGTSQIMYRRLRGEMLSDPIAVARSSEDQFFPSIGRDGGGFIWLSWMAINDSSGFPNDDPQKGVVHVAKLEDEEFISNKEMRSGSLALYPNLPDFTYTSMMPVLYESPMSEEAFEIVLESIQMK